MDRETVVFLTKRWIADLVIGLNLCPFARRVFDANTIRYVVSAAEDEVTLLRELNDELTVLVNTPIEKVETTLIIHPQVLGDFLDYNEFLETAEALIEERKLDGVVQIASFHPHYQFEGASANGVENYTNRSPYPMLHLLREASISAVAEGPDELAAIPERNINTLRGLGLTRILKKLQAIRCDPPPRSP